MEKKRSNFTGSIGFVLAAAGSAVGLGNIWRFPYLAAKGGGGVFILCYVVLALTFGFTLLTTEIAIGRKTGQSPLTAYEQMHKGWGGIGVLACAVPVIILPYYCSIGGWVLKYLSAFLTGHGAQAAEDGYFTGYITQVGQPIIWMLIYVLITAMVVYKGVNKGIEKYSKILMPILFVLIAGISVFSLTLKHTNADGVTRTGMQGLAIYLIPNFRGMTVKSFLSVVMDALGQLFFSISVAMGIMVTYGSYAKKETNLMKSINQIEFFDTLVALLAGLMIIPAVYTFMGTEGMSAGPGLMFVSLPKVFKAMGAAGVLVGIVFFLMVSFAAVTSSVSVMEAIVSSMMDKFHVSRKKGTILTTLYGMIVGVIVCLGYNKLYFELKLPNGTVAQILDVMDYLEGEGFLCVVGSVKGIDPGPFKVQGVDDRKNLVRICLEGWIQQAAGLLGDPFGHGIRCCLLRKVHRIGGGIELLRSLFGKLLLDRVVLLQPERVGDLEDAAFVVIVVSGIKPAQPLGGCSHGACFQRLGNVAGGLAACTAAQHAQRVGKADGGVGLVGAVLGQHHRGCFGAKFLHTLDKGLGCLVGFQEVVLLLRILRDVRLGDAGNRLDRLWLRRQNLDGWAGRVGAAAVCAVGDACHRK